MNPKKVPETADSPHIWRQGKEEDEGGSYVSFANLSGSKSENLI